MGCQPDTSLSNCFAAANSEARPHLRFALRGIDRTCKLHTCSPVHHALCKKPPLPFRFLSPRLAQSLSNILRRISYPIEPFRLELTPAEFAPPTFQGERDRLWQKPSLFDQADDRQAETLKYVHNSANWTEMCFPFPCCLHSKELTPNYHLRISRVAARLVSGRNISCAGPSV
jgi:hypothetical protein